MRTTLSTLPAPVGILGFGVEGQSTLQWLRTQGIHDIIVLDAKPQTLDGVRVSSGENYLDALKDCVTVVRSAGVNPLLQELLRFQMNGGQVTSQVELFLERTRSKCVVGVTGTLGKGSCVTMIEHILKAQDVPCKIGGNYGVAALDLLSDETPERISLLELSSFQLMTQQCSPHIAVVLKTTSEHLDWHRSVEEYRDAKANLVRYQKPQDICVFSEDAPGSREIAAQGRARKFRFGHGADCDAVIEGETLRLGSAELKLAECAVPGIHQLENMGAAALAVQALGISPVVALAALKSYAGLTYRLEYKGSHQGIAFYNDSYATRPEAALAAAASMKQPFAMILGGSEKHADFAEMASGIAGLPLLRGIALIGQTTGRLRTALESAGYAGPLSDHSGLEEAFLWGCNQVQGGGAVLLSPACASFGLFANYKERGKRFDELVERFRSHE